MADEPTKVAVQGSRKEPVSGARAVGPAAGGERFEVTVRVRPKSPLPEPGPGRAVMTHDEFTSAHGAAAADLAAVARFAADNGLNVVETSSARRSVILDGTVAAYQKAFGVTLETYEHPGGTYRGRTGMIHVPGDLTEVVEGIFGLDDRPFARPRYCLGHRRGASARPHASSTPGTFDANEVATLYNFPEGLDGSGQCVAILELGGGYMPSDLAAYFKRIGIASPPVITPVAVDEGRNNPADENASVEVVLDVEVVAAAAPGAAIAVYFAPDATDQSFLDALTQAVHDKTNNPSVVSISWGGPESSPTDGFVTQMNQAIQAAGLLGITVCVASGDNGAADEGPNEWDGKPHVDFPASSPYALACGGTTLKATSKNAAIAAESVWNQGATDTQDDTFGASGGGVSDVFSPPPAWQARANVPKSPNTGATGRGVPDVAADADAATGYDVTMTLGGTLQTFPVGGTSAAAPLWAALIARINQGLGRRVGFVNPALYALAPSTGALNDVTKGNNRVGDSKVGYDSAPGWDPCTGLGTPDGAKLLAALKAQDASSSSS